MFVFHFDYWKVCWHCLMKTFKIFHEDHRVIELTTKEKDSIHTSYYCECGYNEG